MEIKLIISLDERTHETLDRLIDAIQRQTAWTEKEIQDIIQREAGIEAKATLEDLQKTPVTPKGSHVEEVAERKADKPTEAPVAPVVKAKSESKITVEELRALAADVKEKQGSTTSVKALLNKYGSKNISSLPEDKIDAFAAELKGLL